MGRDSNPRPPPEAGALSAELLHPGVLVLPSSLCAMGRPGANASSERNDEPGQVAKPFLRRVVTPSAGSAERPKRQEVAPYREACRKAGIECEFAVGGGALVASAQAGARAGEAPVYPLEAKPGGGGSVVVAPAL